MKPINSVYRIFALIMALVIFTSSVSFAIDMHYCQSKLKTVSFFGKAETCHDMMSGKMSDCPQHQEMMGESEGRSISKKGCCDNKSVHIQSDLNQLNSNANFVIGQELQHFVAAFVEVFLINNYVDRTSPSFQFYHPPIVVKDIPVLNQSFLL